MISDCAIEAQLDLAIGVQGGLGCCMVLLSGADLDGLREL